MTSDEEVIITVNFDYDFITVWRPLSILISGIMVTGKNRYSLAPCPFYIRCLAEISRECSTKVRQFVWLWEVARKSFFPLLHNYWPSSPVYSCLAPWPVDWCFVKSSRESFRPPLPGDHSFSSSRLSPASTSRLNRLISSQHSTAALLVLSPRSVSSLPAVPSVPRVLD